MNVESATLAGAFALGITFGILATLRVVRAVLAIFEQTPRRSRRAVSIKRRRDTP